MAAAANRAGATGRRDAHGELHRNRMLQPEPRVEDLSTRHGLLEARSLAKLYILDLCCAVLRCAALCCATLLQNARTAAYADGCRCDSWVARAAWWCPRTGGLGLASTQRGRAPARYNIIIDWSERSSLSLKRDSVVSVDTNLEQVLCR
jgi:hypothetical protein